VDEAINDENSMVSLNSKTMETLQLFRGDTILISWFMTTIEPVHHFVIAIYDFLAVV